MGSSLSNNLKLNFIKNIFKSHITYILIFCFILFIIGINWGLPSKYTWQSDSLAPKTPIYAGFQGFLPGYFHKYPIVHQLILFIVNLPVLIFVFFTDHIFNSEKILSITTFCTLIFANKTYLTILIFIDRFVSLIMGILIVYFIFLSAKELFNEKVGFFSALIIAFNPELNHYSHVAKVEVPYIFWAVLAIYLLIRIVKYDKSKDYIFCAIFICFSFGTKDQGYAIFILPMILYLIIYQILFKEKDQNIFKVVFRKNILIFILVFIISTIIIQNPISNLEGLIRRYNLLTGEGGTRSISYTLGFNGIYALFIDTSKSIIRDHLTLPFFLFCIFGFLLIFYYYKKDVKQILLSSIFLISSISYYLFFVQIIRQSSERFQFPIALFIAVYGGFFIYFIFNFLKNKMHKIIFLVLLFFISLFAFYNTLTFNVNILFDVRYKAEEWMAKNIEAKSIIERYSGFAYLPRLPENIENYKITDEYDVLNIEERKPNYLLLTSKYYTRYLHDPDNSGKKKGRLSLTDKEKKFLKTDFNAFFNLLFQDKLNYKLEKRFEYENKFFQHIGLTPQHILIYKRKE